MPSRVHLADHLVYLASLRRPALALRASERRCFSRLGGLPELPVDLAWPEWEGRPLAFLCQISFAETAGADIGLPDHGQLYVFYEQEQATAGFDPEDRGSFKVLYSEHPISECRERALPPGLEVVFPAKPVEFAAVDTYPDWQDDRVQALDLSEPAAEEYIELCAEAAERGPAHRLLGYPTPVQDNDMDLECQLVTHGIYCGDASGYANPQVMQLQPGRSDWQMLLQIDSDDDTEMMWGDVGRLYFWIRKQDLERRRFDDCWMILQCG